ncbi:tetratricopeptide repeat protein [Psychroserpens ponticola]|uniref:Tetratricopeptide repeat protein n=1 Tax=Psychroserpens ponticola TaxID=2932268 RepID=A0ABY7RT01_9FLAO|nr:hypothetical protein [Psychroserpens ponticola]WCO00237.1 hypothetical protein MUN68_009130 [Psychroserpens ponticola]
MTKHLIFLLFIITLNSCANNEKSTHDNKRDNIINGTFYENDKARDLNEKGIELSRNGNYKEGNVMFLRALELEPNNPTTLSNLGLNNYFEDDYDNSIKYFQESYKVSDSTYHMAAANLAMSYFYNEEYDKGIKIANYVINHTDDKVILSSAYVNRAFNHIGNNNCEKAKTDIIYIYKNYRAVKNIEYHLKDLAKKMKNCVQQRV